MIDSNTTATFDLFFVEVDDGTNLRCNMTLYCCCLDNQPDFSDAPSIEKVGVVVVHFKKADVQRAEKCYNKDLKKTVFKINFKVEMKLDTEQGTLSFQSFVNKKKAGRTTINYAQIEHNPIAIR